MWCIKTQLIQLHMEGLATEIKDRCIGEVLIKIISVKESIKNTGEHETKF